MQLRPLQDRVVVQRLDEETKTAGELSFLIATQKNHPRKIVAVETGYRNTDGTTRNLDVKVGDTVSFRKIFWNSSKSRRKEVLVMKEDEILGILH